METDLSDIEPHLFATTTRIRDDAQRRDNHRSEPETNVTIVPESANMNTRGSNIKRSGCREPRDERKFAMPSSLLTNQTREHSLSPPFVETIQGLRNG